MYDDDICMQHQHRCRETYGYGIKSPAIAVGEDWKGELSPLAVTYSPTRFLERKHRLRGQGRIVKEFTAGQPALGNRLFVRTVLCDVAISYVVIRALDALSAAARNHSFANFEADGGDAVCEGGGKKQGLPEDGVAVPIFAAEAVLVLGAALGDV